MWWDWKIDEQDSNSYHVKHVCLQSEGKSGNGRCTTVKLKPSQGMENCTWLYLSLSFKHLFFFFYLNINWNIHDDVFTLPHILKRLQTCPDFTICLTCLLYIPPLLNVIQTVSGFRVNRLVFLFFFCWKASNDPSFFCLQYSSLRTATASAAEHHWSLYRLLHHMWQIQTNKRRLSFSWFCKKINLMGKM